MKQQRLPFLDIALYYSNRAAFVEELRAACHTVGFFLIKHDFPQVGDAMLEESRRFFRRKLSEKQEISYEKSPSFRGYMKVGVENTSGKLDRREQIEYAVEYPKSSASTGWPVYERLKSTNPWPSFQPTMRKSTNQFVESVCQVADCIRDSLCLALTLDPQVLSASFEHPNEVPHWAIKMISYPPKEDDEEDACQGVGAHTDTNFLTLVLQDSVGGLQAFSQGEWVDVPCEGSGVLVCNLGEQAEIWSRGYFLATPHRVLGNSSTTNRISVPLFYNPVLSACIEPLNESTLDYVQWDRPKNYKHWRRENNKMLPTVGENTFKSLARSHPEVFEQHHPDLMLLEDGRILLRER